MKKTLKVLLGVGSLLILRGTVDAQTCQADLHACEIALEAASQELATALRDSDGDRIRDVDDECPATSPGVAVDANGCSLDQFCSRQVATTSRDRRTCRRLDWRNDEPEKVAKKDCAPATRTGFPDFVCASTSGSDPGSACTTVELLLDYPDGWEPSGAALGLRYPPSVSLPGFLSEPSVVNRVENRTGITNGLFGVSDVEDAFPQPTLNVGLISLQQVIPKGSFVLVHFDCVGGHMRPTSADFDCAPDVSTIDGDTVPAACTIVVR